MRGIDFLLNVRANATLRNCALILVLLCLAGVAQSQPIAGIKANGRIMNPGDTVTICIGGTVVHETTAQNFSWIQWRFNNGTPTSGISGFQPVTYTTPGLDTSWQTVSSPLGRDSTYILVWVHDVKPTANFTFAPNGACANLPINFTNTSSGTGLQYAWNFNDVGITSTQQNPTHQFLNAVGAPGPQNYNVTLVVKNEFQCVDSITKVVTVQKMPDASIANADPNIQFSMFNGIPTFKKCDILGGNTHNFQFQGASTTPGIISGYTIDWGDNSPPSTFATLPPIFSHTYSVGQYVMMVTANSSAGGCIGIKKYNVFFGTTPAGGLIPLPNNSICAPNILNFPVTGASTNAESTTYTFTVNDGTDPITYSHPNLPGAISHLFTSGSCGNFSSNGTQSFSNSFRVTLAIENACGVTSSSVIPIYVSGKPKASVTSPVVACVGVPTAILNTSLMGGTITPTGGGNSTCTNNTRQVWTISPATGFTINSGSLGSFNGNQNNYLVWTSGSQALDVTFTQTGTYTIKLRVGNDCGYDEITRTICVRNPPSASFTVNNKIGCGPLTPAFNNTSPINTECLGDTYSWDISYLDPSACAGSPNYNYLSGTNSSSRNPQIQFVYPGIYVVKLSVIASGSTNCVAVATDTIKVLTKPKVIINPIGAVCLGVPISPTAQVSNCYSNAPIDLAWTFANGSPASSNQLVPGVINYSSLGSHPVTLQATNECGVTTATANVIITTSPTANAGPDIELCSGDTGLIGSAPFAGINYSWAPMTGLNSSNSGNPLISLTYTGPNDQETIPFILTASAGPTCVKKDTVLVTVKKKPVMTVSPAPSPVCTGTPVNLNANGAANFAWTPALGLNTSTGASVIATPASSTLYTVIGTSANGCAAAASVQVTVLPNAPVNAGNDTTVCSFSPVIQLSATPVGGTWAGSAFLSATGSFDVPSAGNGVYTLTYTKVTGGCTRIDTVVVTVINTPVVNAGADSTFCQNNIAVQLNPTPMGGRWSGSPFVSQNGVFNTSVAGTYTLIYTYGSGLCIGIDTVVHTVIPGISNNTIASDQTICTGTIPTTLVGQDITGGSGTPAYQWQYSTNNFTWINIPGATARDFSPDQLTVTTFFRRIASTIICSGNQRNFSSSVKISVNPNAKAEFTPIVTTGCPPFAISSSIINLTPHTNLNSEYHWYVNGTIVGTGENFPGFTINANNGTATVMLVALSAYGCKSDTISHVFTASGTPLVNAGADTTVCSGTMPFAVSGSPAGGTWSGSPFVAFNGIFNPAVAGSYTIVYTVGSGACIAKDTLVVNVSAGLSNNVISSDQTICAGQIPATLQGQTPTGGNGTITYQWQSSTNNFTWTDITGATGVSYSPGLLTQNTWFRRIASSNLCAGNISDPVKITINPNAIADFQPLVTSGCPPFTITSSIINLIPQAGVAGYFWYVDGSFVANGMNFPGYTIQNNNDSVTITLITTSSFGCVNDTLSHGFIAAGTPVVNAGADTTICSGSAPFQLTGIPAGGRWSGSPFVSINGLFNPFTPGTYTLAYTYGSGACLGSDTMVVTVSAGLSNNAIAADQTTCTGAIPATIIGQNVTGGNGNPTYQWQSSTNNITWADIAGAKGKDHTPQALTQTTWFRRVATDGGCAGNTSAASKITVDPNAVADFRPFISSGCPPFEITPSIINLIPYSSVSDYRWFVNGNLVGTGQVFPGYTIQNNNDSVTVMLVAISAFGCANDTLQHGFIASGTPSVNAGADTSICSGSAPFQLVGSPAGGRWSGSAFVSINGLFNPATAGTYTLHYNVGSGACLGSDTMVVTVSAGLSNNAIAADQTTCTGAIPATIIGQNVTGGNGNPTYQWQSSTNNITWADIAGAKGKDHTPQALTQTTWFRRVATDGGCAGNTSAASKITVDPNAVADFRPFISSGCPPFEITPSIINLIPYSSVSDYRWFVNGNLVGTGQVFPGYTIQNNNDSVTVMLVAISAFGCANDTLQHGFIASGTPSVNAGADTSICSGSAPFQLVGSPAGGRWSGSAFVSINGLFNPATAGTYTLHYNVGSGACIGADTMVVTVSAGLSNNTIAADQTICTGATPATIVGQNVTGGNGNPTYQWQSSTNNITWADVAGATGKEFNPSALTQTTWFRRVTTDGGCAGNTSAAIKITVNPTANADFRPVVTTGCPPFNVTSAIVNLIPYAGNGDYQWFVNGNFLGSGENFQGYTIQNNNDSAVITLVAISAFGCGNDTLSHTFIASGTPAVNAAADTSICSGSAPFQLIGSPAGGRWTGSSFVSINGLFNPATPGTYTLTYSYGSGACIGSDSMTVLVTPGISNNSIADHQVICSGGTAAIIIGSPAIGGTGTPAYQWQFSVNNISWTDIAGASGKDYAPGVLTQTTWFRRIASNGECAANTSIPVKITINPSATALYNPSISSGCPPFVITPSIINLTTFNTVSQYLWYVDGNFVGSGVNFPGFTLANNGDSATIMLVAVSAYGCANDTLQHGFKAAGTPTVFAGPDTILCEGSMPVTLAGSPIGGRWSGSSFVSVAGLFNPSQAGTYTLIYNFGSGACIGSDTLVVTVSPGISNNIISDTQTLCIGTPAALLSGSNISGGNGTPVYQWQQSFNNITWTEIPGATGVNYDPGVLTRTTFFRRIANTSMCPTLQQHTSNVIRILVTPDANADFNPSVFSGCPPFTITPSIVNVTPGNTTASAYLWYANGNFLGSGETFPGYTLQNNNDSVKIMLVLVSAFGCDNDTTSHTFYATGTPGVNAGADTTVCVGGAPFQLKGFPAGGRWTGTSLVSVNGLFNPSAAGTYTLVYTYGSGACIGTDTMEVTVSGGITNNVISGQQEVCVNTLAAVLIGQPVSGGAGAAVYQWQMSTNNVSWVNIPSATAQDYDPGVLTQTTWFRREATTTLCAGAQSVYSNSVKLTVNPDAKAEFNPLITSSCPPFVITPSIVNLVPFASGNSDYRWFANGASIGIGSIFPGYTIINNLDSVRITLVAMSKFGCQNDTLEHVFYASGTPSASAGSDTIVCHNSFPIQLAGYPAGGSWSGPQVTLAGVFTPSVAGAHQLVYTFGTGTCVGRDTMIVTVSEGITNNILSGDQTICINSAPGAIIGQVIAGGTTAPEYVWQQSADGITWTNIPGATGKDYQPGVLTANRWFRRIAFTSVCNGLQSSTSAPVRVIVNPDARAQFNPPASVGCTPFTITPSIINLTPHNSVSEYRWYANDNFIGNAQSFPGFTIQNNNDSVRIKLVAISRYGCLNDSSEFVFYSADAPSPAFIQSDSVACGPLQVTFTNSTPNASVYNFFWNFGNGQTSSNIQPQPVTFAVAQGGGDTTYTIRLSAFTACDTFTVTRQVLVRSKPKVHFLPNRSQGCSPFTVSFNNLSSGSSVNYVWDLGDGSAPVATNNLTIQNTYTSGVQKTFNIKLTGTNDCGVDSSTSPIVVTPNAILASLATLPGDTVGCAPHTVRFVNQTTGAGNFQWDFGDGGTLATTNPRDTVQHTFAATGTYNVKLKAIGNCNDTTVAITINVRIKPNIRFTATPLVACIGDTIRFTNNSDAGTESFWRFGDGATSYDRHPVKVFSQPGTYRVRLFGAWTNINSSSCSDSAFVDIVIRDTLPGSFNVSDSVSSCIPFNVSFVNDHRPSHTTTWLFGNGFSGFGDSTNHVYTAIGNYTARMYSRAMGGCVFTATKIISVKAPSGTLQVKSGYACINEDVRFEVRNGNAASYRFIFGDGDSLTTNSSIIFHKYSLPGVYYPYVYLIDGNCKIRIGSGDTIRVDKVEAGFRATSNRECGITTFSFVDTSRGYYELRGWQWEFGDGTVSSTVNPIKPYSTDGIYYIKLQVNSVSGCFDTIRVPINVSVRRAPVGDIGSDTVACTGKQLPMSALIQSQDSVVNIAWNFGNNTAAIGSNVSALYNVSGAYSVQLVTTTLYGCADTTEKMITVGATPLVNAGPDIQICRGQSAPLQVFGASSYSWSPVQDLSCITCPAPIAKPLLSTQYVVRGRTSLGCSNTDTILVNVVQPITLKVSPNDTICIGEQTQLFATGATRYMWNPVQGLSNGNAANPIASPTSTTDYMVIGTDPYNCFSDTGHIRVVVGPYPTVKLRDGGTVLVGSVVPLGSAISNGPIIRYHWSPDEGLSCNDCIRPLATIDKPTTYRLEVENVYGCIAADTTGYNVKCEESLQVYIPNAFSPDNDGLNDVFMIRGKGLSAVKYFRVFNRWGQLIFERSNIIANDPKQGWDGKVNGVPANPDVYVYTAEVLCAAGDTFIRKGNVTLVR